METFCDRLQESSFDSSVIAYTYRRVQVLEDLSRRTGLRGLDDKSGLQAVLDAPSMKKCQLIIDLMEREQHLGWALLHVANITVNISSHLARPKFGLLLLVRHSFEKDSLVKLINVSRRGRFCAPATSMDMACHILPYPACGIFQLHLLANGCFGATMRSMPPCKDDVKDGICSCPAAMGVHNTTGYPGR